MNFHKVEFETSYGVTSKLPPPDYVEVAFAGKSNVGKSSLINKLFNRKNLARVSAMPGKTTTINYFKLDDVRFVDLPGYGFAKVSKSEKERWGKLMERYFNSERNLVLVVQLLDMRHPPTRDDRQMIDYLIENEFPFILVLTKRDKLSKAQQAQRLLELEKELEYFDQLTVLPVSSESGEGIEELRALIEEVTAEDESEGVEETEPAHE